MKRFLALALLCALLLPALTACHGARGMEPFAIPSDFDPDTPVQITFWAKNDTNKTQTDIYKKAIADFEALYPAIDVSLRLYTDYGRIYQDVITNIQTATTPDVCITYPDHIATYTTGSAVVVPLDELIAHPAYGLGGSALRFDSPTAEQIVPRFLSECYLGDTLYGLPYMRSTEACYVNKTYVEKLGYTLPEVLTWDFIWEVSEAAAQKDEEGNYLVNGQKVMLPFIYKSTDNMMITMLRQKGAGYSTDRGSIELFNQTTDALLLDLAEHVKKGAFSTFKISGYPANYLNAGQCIFAIDSTAGATWMGSSAPLLDIPEDQIVPFETAVLPIPQFDPEHPAMISQGPSLCVFNKEDPHRVMASWLFAQFLLTNEVQIAYAKTEGYVPVTLKAQTSEEYLDYLSRSGEDNDLYYDVKLAATRLMLDRVDQTFTTPVFNGSTSLRTAAGMLIESVTKSIRRKETVDGAYLGNLYQEMSSLYRLRGGGQVNITHDEESPLPPTAIALLGGIGLSWLLLGVYWLKNAKKRSQEHK